MPKACAYLATAPPMEPRPITPRTLPFISVPVKALRSHLPSRIEM